MELISSLHNPRVQAWRSLRDRKGRDLYNAFLVEGTRMVREAVDSDFELQTILVREGFILPFPLPAAVPVCSLPDHVFASVTDTRTPQGIAAVLTRRMKSLSGSRFVALDAVQDPGNVGTIIRTADAAGFDGILLGPDCADLYSPKVLRSTMGSVFRMSFAFPDNLPDMLRSYREKGFSVLSSQLDGDPFYERAGVSSAYILVIGNEGNGISEPVKAEASHRLRLPMRGGAESLNAAVAAGIMMYDLIHYDNMIDERKS